MRHFPFSADGRSILRSKGIGACKAILLIIACDPSFDVFDFWYVSLEGIHWVGEYGIVETIRWDWIEASHD